MLCIFLCISIKKTDSLCYSFLPQHLNNGHIADISVDVDGGYLDVKSVLE